MCSLRLSAKACVSRLSTKAHGCLSTCCRAGGVPLTTPVIVTGFVLDPAKARPPTKVDASGMLMVSCAASGQLLFADQLTSCVQRTTAC